MTAARDIMVVLVFDIRCIISMTGARDSAQVGVVLRARVGIFDNAGYGCPAGAAVGDDMCRIGLLACGRGLIAARRASIEKELESLQVNGNAGRDAVERAADGRRVGLTEYAELEDVAGERRHADSPYSCVSSTMPPSS